MTFEEIDQKIVQLSNDFEGISSITTNDFKGIGQKTYARALDDLRDSYRNSALCSFSSAGSGVPQFTEDTNIIRIDFDAIGKLQNIIFDALKTHDASIKEMKTSVTAMEWEGEDKNAAINLWNTIAGETSAAQRISDGIDKYYNVLYNACAYYETAQSKSAETELRNPIQIQTQKLRDIAAYLIEADKLTNFIKVLALPMLADLGTLVEAVTGSAEKIKRLGAIIALNNGELSKIGNSMINTATAFEEADANIEIMRQKDLVDYYSNSLISDQDTSGMVGNNTQEATKAHVPQIVTAEQMAKFGWENMTQEQLDDLNRTLDRYQINTPERIQHFMSQCAKESQYGYYTQEIASGESYNNRTDLGNTQPGDGPRFKGAGYIQLTGRANYQELADAIGDPKIMTGDAGSTPSEYVAKNYPWSSAGYWWDKNNMNKLVDSGASVEQVTQRVNGGQNGIDERKTAYAKAQNTF